MKELSIEEKAKRYDKAIEKLRSLHDNYDTVSTLIDIKEELENIFPELKESEDERIRENIIATIHLYYGEPLEDEAKEMIAWLEKQGKNDMGISEATKQKLKDNLNKALEKETPESWNKFLDEHGSQILANSAKISKDEQKPAESRQETKPNGGIVCEDFKDGDGYYKVNLAYLNKSQVEFIESLVASWQNPTNNASAWSEEDERMLNDTLDILSGYYSSTDDVVLCDNINKAENWLKSLKDRVQPQPKQEWSEEDINLREATIGLLNLIHPIDAKSWGKSRLDCIDWLKSLKPQSQWKPSDEQMYNLSEAAHCDCVFFDMEILKGLLEDLKKLRKE